VENNVDEAWVPDTVKCHTNLALRIWKMKNELYTIKLLFLVFYKQMQFQRQEKLSPNLHSQNSEPSALPQDSSSVSQFLV
jgi:hypothetical protein